MRKQMTLAELDAYFHETPAALYSYAAKGQDWAEESAPFWFALSFRELIASEKTHSVVLQTEQDFVLFEHVESVELDDGCTILGPVIRLRCAAGGKEHTLLAINKR